MQNAWKVGLASIAFLAMIMSAYWLLGRPIFGPRAVTYYALLPDAAGIASGSRVTMAGVPIGTVTAVELAGPREARVTFAVRPEVRIPRGSTASVPFSFLALGDRQLVVNPPEAPGFDVLPPGSVLPGVPGGALDSLLPEANVLLEELTATLRATREVLGDEDLRRRLDALLASSAQTSERFGELARTLDRLVKANESEIQQSVRQTTTTLRNIAAVSDELARVVRAGEWDARISSLASRLDDLLVAGKDTVSSLNRILDDPELVGGVKELLASTKALSDEGMRLAGKLTDLAERGTTVVDNAAQISENGILLSERSVEFAEKAVLLAEDARTILARLEQAILRIAGGTGEGGPRLGSVRTRFDQFRETSPGRWRSEVGVRIPFRDQTVHVGLWDAFESNKVTLQLASPVSDRASLRYGVYASKPGFGVDLRVLPEIDLRADVFDLNEPRLDLRARFGLGRGIHGWVGLERVFDRNAPSVGLGIER